MNENNKINFVQSYKPDSHARVELVNGRIIDVPESWGLVHDVSGKILHRCDLFVAPYQIVNNEVSIKSAKVKKAAKAYFGVGEGDLLRGNVAIPTGPWHHIGNVSIIYYQRWGSKKKRGLYHHDFEFPVKLYEQKDKNAYRLALPDACIINERGFVWP